MIAKPGLERVLDLLTRIAAGDLDATVEPTGDDETSDALVVGLRMLAEELSAERTKREAAEVLLTDERDAYHRSAGLLCSIDASTLCILKCNDTLEQAVGIPADELIGQSVVTLFGDGHRTFAEEALRAAATGEANTVPELWMRGAHGKTLRVVATISRTETPSPRLRVAWSDVTTERRLEAQLGQAQKMQAVGRLSGGIAHDFNNILGVILGAASFLQDIGADSPNFKDDLQLIEQAAKRGADLTAQLLAFSRQQIAQPKRVELGGLMRETDRMLRRLIGEGITLSLDIPDASLHVLADASQLTQVLLNLVVNARDALRGHGHITVELEHVQLDQTYSAAHLEVAPGQYALISVTDDGPGMSADVMDQAFEPFFTTKPHGEGTGLGLSVCYGIVRQAGGHIVLYSEPHRGTTVRVYLPLDLQSVDTRISPTRSDAHDSASEIVLLVEDDPILRQLTMRVLDRAGYQVVAAANGEEALLLMANRPAVDVVVTDVVMPKLGGRALAEQLLALGKTGAVLYLSGYTANSIVHHGVLDDGVHFLAKPFTADQLLRALRRSLGRE